MFTFNTLLKEIKEMPTDKLEEVYEFVHAINTGKKQSAASRKKILSFAGAFADMSAKDYTAFLSHTKKIRKNLFNRSVEL